MAILITDAAADQVKNMMTANNLAQHVVRLGVSAGGCSGYSYMLDIVDDVQDNDRVFVYPQGVSLVCDPRSYLYLNGTIVDFSDELMGGGFKFDNPNVSRSCGCGTSFMA